MKKLTFLTTILALIFWCANLNAQDLIKKQGKNGKWGFVDKTTNEIVIPYKYLNAREFNEGLAAVEKLSGWCFIDKKGDEVIQNKYISVLDFSDGLAAVQIPNKVSYSVYKTRNKVGFIDKTGKVILPPIYNNSRNFSEGLAAVQINNKWGFIDKNGNIVIPLNYDNIDSFLGGVAAVKLGNKWGFIDKTGKEFIPLKYDGVKKFEGGLAYVIFNGKWGLIDFNDNVIVPFEYNSQFDAQKALSFHRGSVKIEHKRLANAFSTFAKTYVEQKIIDWQQRGEFEKTIDWQQRVNETTRQAKADELLKEAEKPYITERSKNFDIGTMTLGTYDSDNEIYLIINSKFGDWLVPVPINEAPVFKSNWSSIKHTPIFGIIDDQIALSEVDFTTPEGKTYTYSNQASLNFTVAKIDYNFAPLEFNITPQNQVTPKGEQTINTVNLSVGKSDVAVNIPVNNINNDKTFAVIIANEDYQERGISQVTFAINDGSVFKEYCIKTFGIPERNIRYRSNATLNNIRSDVRWISEVANKYDGDINIIFFYAGHGTNDENSQLAYLLPVDGLPLDARSAFKLEELYQTLGNLPAKSVTIFLDACYSGTGRDDRMLAETRGVKIKARQGVPVGNTVVFSAAQGDETAHPHDEKQHGMFTYFLLKKLQETKGDVTFGELGDYITTQVGRESIIVKRKSQTPMVTPSATVEGEWRNRKLK